MRPYDTDMARRGHSDSCAAHGGGDCTCGRETEQKQVLTALEILEAVAEFSPGMIDGAADGVSGADLLESFAEMMTRLEKPLRQKLERIAAEARRRIG